MNNLSHWWTPPYIQKLFPGLIVAGSLSLFCAIAYRSFWPPALVMAAAVWGTVVARREFGHLILLSQDERLRGPWRSWLIAFAFPSQIFILVSLATEPTKTLGFVTFLAYSIYHTDRLFRRLDRVHSENTSATSDPGSVARRN